MSPHAVDDRAVARWRFRTQLLDGRSAPDGPAAVRSLLAVQAENLDQTGWALASRSAAGLPPATMAGLLADGTLVRTHVLRPTWHLVHRADLRWLLELTGPRVRRQVGRQLERDLGLDPATVAACTDVVLAALAETPDLTRDELGAALEWAGRPLDGMRLMVLLAHAEMGLHLGSGTPRPEPATATGTGSATQTYRLLDGRLDPSPHADRDEALAALTRRYVLGHGPATERDLAYWATLTLTDVRAGIASAAAELESFEHDGRTFWHAPGETPPPRPRTPRVHLLHLLDEWYRGHQDSRLVVDADGLHPVGREPSIGLLAVDAQIAGTVRRTVRPASVAFDVTPYRPLTAAERRALDEEAARYGAHLERTPVLTVAGG
ncbi:winged helix DNA-binding domain-containing protein [Phycicoccus sp. HDW14]|uniref:winged helix DNA-binding domain-containing protein n=1 Tax=Phycicoccus sp. HDW14 TaxID=2714941 RepID=UPI0014079BE3|nr:winged helix DNA-binding domain-containing protein [Phycicoccus sp. HDW14]QIM22699.1 winged helix DNA-binding domain-containing protein [Phycicoccus sp. HDW14]